MSKESSRGGLSSRRAVGIGSLIVVIVVAALLLNPDASNDSTGLPAAQVKSQPSSTHAPESEIFEPPQITPANRDQIIDATAIANAEECTVRLGRGGDRNAAIVVVREPESVRYSVFDKNGHLVSDSLPFNPNHVYVAKRTDGSVLSAFGDLRLNSIVTRGRETDEPVAIYLDNQVIYESSKVWNLGIARDGSAFYVVEPQASDTSRLIVHDVNSGTEHHYDLGYQHTSMHDELPFSVRFTRSGDAVEFSSSGSFHFYPVDGGSVRTARITPDLGYGAVMDSADFAYITRRDDSAGRPQVTKLRFGQDSAKEPEVIWTKTMDAIDVLYDSSLTLSEDGPWLILGAWNLHVLNTDTGETAFTFPAAGNPEAARERLDPVMKGESTDELGAFRGIEIIDDQLLIRRRFGNAEFTHCTNLAKGEEACVNNLKQQGVYYEALDVFPIEDERIAHYPSQRTILPAESKCKQGYFHSDVLVSDTEGQLRHKGASGDL